MELKDKRKCTSKTYKKGEQSVECGIELLMVMGTDGTEGAWICPDCDGLEFLPKKMRERILEQ
jgi:hypothetical protein